MQIRNIGLDRFGACAEMSLDSLTDGVNVIYGPAGSGKATLGRFVRSILYGFDDSTRRQYLPVDSRGYGGALTIQTLSGTHTITRVDDGSHDGQPTVGRDHGTAVGRSKTAEEVAAIPESTFERIYAVDYRRRPGIGALIEEAHASGLDLLGRSIGLESLSVSEQQLRQLRDSLATVPRVQATHDELSSRRVELLRVISELESALGNQPDEESLSIQITHFETQLGESQAKLRELQNELKITEVRRHQLLASRNIDPTTQSVDAPQLQELNELVAQIMGWQQTLRAITARRQSLEEKADQYGASELSGVPRRRLGEIESQIDDVQSTLAGLDESAKYHGHEVRSLFTDVFAELRANVYRLCNQLSDWEATARHQDCSSEAKDLVRCESELRLTIQRASARQGVLQADIEQLFGEDAVALTPWNNVNCECVEHPPLRAETLFTDAPTDWEHELSVVSSQISVLERQQDRLISDADDVESDLQAARARLRLLDRVEILDQLDAKRAELRRVEQNLRDSDRRRKVLEEIATLEEAISEVRSDSRTSSLTSDASEYVRRLTAGDLRKIEVAANEQVWVVDEHGRRRAYHQLSDGGRDLVYLSICLALVEGFKSRGVRVPMIVSGVFTHVDSKNVPEAAELLRDFAARDHQILLFTRHEHVASVFRLLNVPTRALERVALPSDEIVNDEALDSRRKITEEIVAKDTASEFTLSEHSSIEEAPAIDATSAARLRNIGVMRVGDLLRLSAKLAATELRDYGITTDQIISWKAQTRLVCEVPRLRGYDARILVACGITEAEALYRLSPSELRTIVKDVAASSDGQALLLSGTEFELSRVADWIGTRRGKAASEQSSGSRQRDPSSNRGERSSRGKKSRSRGEAEPGRRERSPDVVKMRSNASQYEFYLGGSDAVVDAPSIGARTAERLEAIGITTIADLLKADPGSVSEQLDVKRFTTKVITGWQNQMELACRVPQLRGHDAQILVALGVTDVEELAASDPQELWTLVKPFVETKEGKRIIRNGKTPDLDEVTEWVQRAQASRQLNAA
ncbi:MAG: DUF4332 domain-containing protein [Planctomycetes bacterium]|nr:DUF4332 domain-containing protein [Planctomycetota bacterium]